MRTEEKASSMKKLHAAKFNCQADQVALGVDELDDDTVILANNISFKLIMEMPENLRVIKGNVDFWGSQIKTLGQLESIGGFACFKDSRIKTLSKLKSIGGYANFEGSSIKTLGKLRSIGGYARFRDSQIKTLGQLESIGEDACFECSQVENIGQLQNIGGNAYFSGKESYGYSRITTLGQLRSIGGNVHFDSSPIETLGQLRSIGGFACFRDSQIESLGELENVGGVIYADRKSKLDFSGISHGGVDIESCFSDNLLSFSALLYKRIIKAFIWVAKKLGYQETKELPKPPMETLEDTQQELAELEALVDEQLILCRTSQKVLAD